MPLIPSSIKNEWKNLAEQLNDNVGGLGGRCTLIFSAGLKIDTTVAVDPIGSKQRTMMTYGGRSPARNLTGSETANENSSGLKEQILEKTINARVYSVSKPFERFSMGLQDNQNVYTVITDKKHMPDILSCKEAILNIDLPEKRIRAKLMRPPAVYGLGQAVQCKSFWEVI